MKYKAVFLTMIVMIMAMSTVLATGAPPTVIKGDVSVATMVPSASTTPSVFEATSVDYTKEYAATPTPAIANKASTGEALVTVTVLGKTTRTATASNTNTTGNTFDMVMYITASVDGTSAPGESVIVRTSVGTQSVAKAQPACRDVASMTSGMTLVTLINAIQVDGTASPGSAIIGRYVVVRTHSETGVTPACRDVASMTFGSVSYLGVEKTVSLIDWARQNSAMPVAAIAISADLYC